MDRNCEFAEEASLILRRDGGQTHQSVHGEANGRWLQVLKWLCAGPAGASVEFSRTRDLIGSFDTYTDHPPIGEIVDLQSDSI